MPIQESPVSGGGELRYLPWLLAALVAYIIYFGTPWGPGLTPDAMWYMRSAGSLAKSWDLTQLPTQWPPGFPITLALVQFAVGSFFTAARILQAVFGAVSVLLFCRLLERSGLSRPYSVLTALLLMLQPAFLDVHLMLWSEPMFLSVVLLDLLLLQSMLDGGAKPSRSVWLGLVCAIAIMLRYAGLFLVPVNAAAVVFLSGQEVGRRQRVLSALTTIGLSVLPLLAWTVFNVERGQSATNRILAWHPAASWHLRGLLHTAAGWAQVPDSVGWLVVLATVVALILGLLAARWERSKSSLASAALSLCALAYATFLWLSISFADYATPLDERILSPVFPVCLAVMAILAKAALDRLRGFVFPLVVVLAWMMVFGGQASWKNWNRSRHEGVSLSRRELHEMPVLAWFRGLPPQARILSNGPELTELYLQRDAQMLPPKFSPASRVVDAHYPQTLAAAMSHEDLVVYFYPMAERDYLASPTEIDQVPGFRKAYDGPDAIVWTRTSAGTLP
jgi:4-amino-4-deoxy-L-arabinose transferase-like glycosyltransferase